MKETVLNALLQLFAIIANVSEDGVSFKARSIVKNFLRQHLKTNLINRYLLLFDQYLEIHHPYLFGGGIVDSGETLTDSAKLQRITAEINRSLIQREKFVVFLRLVEFINEDEVMTHKELAFIRTVADSLNISRSEHHNTRAFVLNTCGEIEKDKLLIIDNQETPFLEGVRHIRENELGGRITILHHESTDTFIFRYTGNMNLFLNGQPIIPDRIELMDQGSLITGTRISPVYHSDISRKFHHKEEATRIYFVAEEIEYRFKNSNKGIKKFSFSKESGNLIGIMGGSGAGKSTLLNMLSGKLKPQHGRITINGIDIYEEESRVEGIIGFVPQDDLLIEELSVFRNLYLNAKLCLSNYSETEILRKINQILTDLDLEDIKYLKVGNPLKKYISGGQRKRLNIALELIREPAVLFVDEPTSGLSSMGSEKVMLLLKEQALKGRLVIVNIHQPYSDIFKLFDKFLILDKEGHVIYKGNPIDAITYFKSLSNYVNADVGHCPSCGNVMPEEILKIVEAKEVDEFGRITRERKVAPEEWYGIYREKIESKHRIKPVNATLPSIDFKIPNLFEQFRIFSLRNILSKLANRQYMLINFLEAPLLALIIGFFTKYSSGTGTSASYLLRENVNLPAYLFMAVIVSLFMGLMVSAEEIIRDRKILERESFLRLSRISYLHSKILVLFLISAIQAFSFVIVGNSILEIKGMLFQHWAMLFTVSCLANMIGLNISSGLDSVVTTYIIIPFIVVPQLLFSGVLINFDKLNNLFHHPSYVPVIGEIMTSRWAYEAMAVHQFKDNRFNRELFPIEQRKNNAAYYSNFLIPELQTRLNEIDYQMTAGKDVQGSAGELELIRNELQELGELGIIESFGNTSLLDPGQFNHDLYRTITDSLEVVREHFVAAMNAASRSKDAKSEELLQRWGGKEAFLRMKDRHTNERLEEILTNKRQMEGIIEWNSRLYRKMDLIYMEPLSNYGRAHFYAPDKRLGSLSIDTFWFNLVIIWFSTLIFYVTLVWDLLRKFTTWNQVRKLRRRK
ncbi:MAG TPA: ATP-binding cassette domain-containing protein [Bacteroides sp.]|nr:ATP-binding cassette domain-containing protein [Bacteroides sp.]